MKSVKEDRWVKTVCNGCYGSCSVRVHVIDGVAVKVEGDSDSVMGSQGGVCAKSSCMIQQLYHPQRLNYPMKRTNPNKGIGVDPRWKRISWDEALGEIAERMKKIHQENPGKLVSIFGPGNYPLQPAMIHGMWYGLYGTYPGMAHLSVHCGNSAHLFAGLNHCSWSVIPDYDYCNYVLQFGSNKGVGSGHSSAIAMLKAAEARARGMKVVAFDPMCNFAGGKAKEWIPILPGTDSAVSLAIANVIVNELGMYDVEFLKRKTNLPYLVKPDGTFARDEETGEPLIWDETAGRAKKWNEPIGDEALEGTYEVQGAKCQTSFSLLKEHLKQYTPEWAERQSTVPASTIHRLANEFATNARIGSTIEVNGVKLPYRPVSAIQFRGGQGHTNGSHSYLSVDLLNQLVGACEVPGGTASWAIRSVDGYPGRDNPKFTPFASKDGLLGLTAWYPMIGSWPHPKPKPPTKPDLTEVFTTACVPPIGCQSDAEEIWGKFEVPPYEMGMIWACNPLMSTSDPEMMLKRFKEMFIGHFLIHPNETSEAVADIVLPDTSSLEFTDFSDGEGYFFNYPMGMLDWEYHIRNKVVEPTHERRFVGDVYLELADMLEMRVTWMWALGGYLSLTGCPTPWQPDEKLTWEQMTDRVVQARFGPEHDLEWFKEHGFLRWPKKPEEAYWRWFTEGRSSIYNEWLIEQGKDVREICEPRGVELDWQQFTPLTTYFPSVLYKADRDPQYDLLAFGYRDILHNSTGTQGLPWLYECSEMNPFTFTVHMNAGTAAEKGIKEGDSVYIENELKRRIKVNVHLIEGIHPETIGMTCGTGHWLDGHMAEGRGGHLNALLVSDMAHHEPIGLSIETAVRVRVYKAEE